MHTTTRMKRTQISIDTTETENTLWHTVGILLADVDKLVNTTSVLYFEKTLLDYHLVGLLSYYGHPADVLPVEVSSKPLFYWQIMDAFTQLHCMQSDCVVSLSRLSGTTLMCNKDLLTSYETGSLSYWCFCMTHICKQGNKISNKIGYFYKTISVIYNARQRVEFPLILARISYKTKTIRHAEVLKVNWWVLQPEERGLLYVSISHNLPYQ